MKREARQVAYSFEHGDTSLPHLKDLVSDIPDPEKGKIIAYLKAYCHATCPGILYDEVDSDQVIGSGNVFTDGTYFWNDAFINYVNKYNIPVPEAFRNHILNNYAARMKRHKLLKLMDCVEIQNHPYQGRWYKVRIHKNGVIYYQNSTDYTVTHIQPEDARYIIDPIMTELFCYDADDHGVPMIDGYHWKLRFYKNSELYEEIEGRPSEDPWRYQEIKRIIEFAERYISKDIGSGMMNFYEPGFGPPDSD